jgi:hypothetical protein
MPSNQYQAARDSIKAERQAVWDRYSRKYDQHQLSERQKDSDDKDRPLPGLPSSPPWEGPARIIGEEAWWILTGIVDWRYPGAVTPNPGDDIHDQSFREK